MYQEIIIADPPIEEPDIDMIPDLQYQFLMKIMMFCGIIYFMQNW